MGKYDHVFGAEGASEKTLRPEEAVAAIAVVTIFADGQPSDEENQVLTEIINSLDIFEDYAVEEFQKMFDKITGILNQEGIGVLFNTAVDALSDDLIEISFEVAVEIILSEESDDESEDTFLDELAEALGLPEEIAQEIIDDLIDDELIEDDEEV